MGLREQLRGIIPEEVRRHVSSHFDVIGDVAVISLPPELDDYKQVIAATIISRRRNIFTVLNKVTKITGDMRTAHFEILAGETTVTQHKEFGFRYRLDVKSVFFNVRMGYERMRVIDQVEPGEKVYVPFAGVGPYAIPAAAKGAHVVAVEQNPDAFRWLYENAGLNKVRDTLDVIRGDAFDTMLLPHRRFDRVIIPTPYGMDSILDVLIPVTVPGGMIHFYTFRTRKEIPSLVNLYRNKGLDITYSNTCGNVAPGVSRWVFDLVRTGSQNRPAEE
jgi:tRNA (guanine37-N1)-methyltransferase